MASRQMRRAIYRGDAEEARALFGRSQVIHLATTDGDGDPILRTVHSVLVRGGAALAFHGAPAGEKMQGIRRRAVASAEEVVASIPSFFVDPERACPATTYYVSAQAHGVIEPIDDPREKAEVLSRLMSKHQPEGGYRAIGVDDPLYTKAVEGLFVAALVVDRISCKRKLGQNRSPAARIRILERLWERGRPEDVRAIATIVAASPELPLPPFLRSAAAPEVAFSCGMLDGERDEVTALLRRQGAYWLEGLSTAEIASAIEHSPATVLARDRSGELVGFARAVSDGRVAWIYDVVIAEGARGGGLGTALMRLLLDHPIVRCARLVRLGTRDAMDFYRRLGFCDVRERPIRRYPVTEMVLARSEGQTERGAAIPRADHGEDARALR